MDASHAHAAILAPLAAAQAAAAAEDDDILGPMDAATAEGVRRQNLDREQRRRDRAAASAAGSTQAAPRGGALRDPLGLSRIHISEPTTQAENS